MITGMGNLGPPLKANSDLLARKGEESPKLARKDRDESGQDSFERTLDSKGTGRPNDKFVEKRPPGEAKELHPPERSDSRMENKNEEANRTVRGKDKGENGKLEVSKNLSPRQRVMQKFMDSMESEFGIPPQRIVEAMAQLDDRQLLQSPEDTAAQVIDQLDLEPKEAEKAEAMYLAMLGTLAVAPAQVRDPQPLSPEQKMFMGAGGLAVGAQAPKLVSSRERRQLLNQSLEQMNNKFFMRPEGQAVDSAKAPALESMKDSATLPGEMASSKAQAFETYRSLAQRPDLAQEFVQNPPASQAPAPVQNAAVESAVAEMQPLSEDEANAEALKALAALGLAAGALAQAIHEDPANAAALKMDQALQQTSKNEIAGSQLQGQQLQGLLAGQGGQGKKEGMSNGGEKGKGNSTSSGSEGLQGLGASPDAAGSNFFVDPNATAKVSDSGKAIGSASAQTNSASAAAGGAAGMTAASKSENHANIQQIMNQAQYMIKKGGGEAIVKMNPEGLGQVHLKVVLNEGKVNVEMQAETKEAKKLLESSLTDLRSSLNTHKLAVDHVKVDVGNSFSGDGKDSTQQRMDQGLEQRDMAREQARQFMGQFREDNQAARDGFYETTGVKAYGSNRGVDPLKPADEAKTQALRRYQSAGKGSGLDLVA